ncbi:MAG: UbiX family flavin prenyltransferase [Deltaproteobacteria bacterium]|nr:UbiX family flavin prenyltransferase [Deltaproteobacteria bacterium]
MGANDKRLVVGISGASGVIYGLEMLKQLKELDYESHLILSNAAKKIISVETEYSVDHFESLASRIYQEDDMTAPIASGSYITMGMVIIPCSIKTLSSITHSYNNNLMTRAADVHLKERRPLVLVIRETPLHSGHLKLMLGASEMGSIILPPIPAFYHKPKNISDLVNQTIGKCMDSLGIPNDIYQRWEGV